jgi:putative acetyltransferase
VPAFQIREEAPSDRLTVHEVQEAAFGRPDEADIVDRVRASASPHLSLVAEMRGRVVGHIFFSQVSIDGSRPAPPSGGLAPVGVHPSVQGRGAGSALIRAGLRACPEFGWKAVFLVGDPAYYSRFGFVLAAPLGLHYESEAFDSAFQVLELEPGALAGCTGWVRYHEAFANV